jgi:hypothetical protein
MAEQSFKNQLKKEKKERKIIVEVLDPYQRRICG